ncbi:metal-dependent hydrolase [Acinetobacter baumannii]|uniref:Metal-dependent hydrolase n=3 Tax=Acinetobacter baumannii TaxID=470 RepID=A0A9P2P762_ACIBA|nr:metal-dependent hydrolase [Acinetobacter baumannii]EKT7960066.1 metal-dependent hydrolase [Acinetobacter baumannii]EKT9125342.1 metal-dependent hydrolase [Acinetobacter baumannii]EKT9270378.1 metal-dependent hydrolase [Acinetobacter baumannii]EKT9312635.1 metal-dependent hydrolase [Acinetobacter baumannii]EKU0108579.1 metal-dependent hydrolase [Acinetobacter baumannii]
MNTALKSDQKIFRRNVELSYDANKSYSFYYEENPVVTSLFVVLSAMFPPGEMFFIESIRNVRSQIKDENLLEDIRAFIAQEAFHSREHKTLNNHFLHSNYPEVIEIEAKTKARLDKLRKLSAVEQVAATVVMEHYTATLARLLLTDQLIKEKTTQESRNLWEWHALEELEHKSVAFDVLNAVGGNSSKNRKLALARVTKLIMPIIFKYWIKILKRKDIKFTFKQLKDGVYLGFGGVNRLGILSKAFVDMLDVRAENFDPLNMQTEQLEAEFREKLFGQAGFLRDYLR